MKQILFPNDAEFWYETQRSFGQIAYGGADFGEVLVISEQITEGDYGSWYDAYLAAADRIAAEAEDALRSGHRVSARDGLLRASSYYRSADFFLQGHPDDPPHYHAYDRSVECFRQAAALFTVPVQPVEIPYENTTLPGYFYPAGDPAVPRPLVIIHTGYDGTVEEMHFQGAAAGAERGYDVLAFDGPGQGSPIRHQGMLFRPDWENVVGPVIDFALTLPGIDPERIVLWGVSMGGVLAPRAAAFEHRLAALVAVDGVYDMGLTIRKYAGDVPDLEQRLRADEDPELDAEFAKAIAASPPMRWATRQGQWVFGAPTPRKASAIQLDYNLRDGIAEKIACPALICDAANDLYFEGQAKLLFDHLTCPKTSLEFTAEEGADAHCQVGAAPARDGTDLQLAGRHPRQPHRGAGPHDNNRSLTHTYGSSKVAGTTKDRHRAPAAKVQENKAMTATTPASSALVRPFTVAIADSEIDDLKQRLARTRWPNPETVPDWSQGVRLENAKSLISYWERGYDWRRFESELNRFPQFLTAIDGLDIHFIHVKSKNPNAMPLILTHGWPGSIVEFLKLIGPLTDPVAFGGDVEDSFDVVVPSLPGFGFSQKPTETGWGVPRIASAWVELMKRLGYKNWAAQGGDWGAVVTTALGAMRPEGLLGIHLNTQYAFPAQIPDTLSPDERHAVETLALYTGDLGGSNHLQGTKPETVGFALADSPAGQAAWIYEKFQSKTDNHGLAEDALSIDDMLDAISLYWFTNSAASSGRIYWENKSATFAGPKLTLPVAVTVFPRDIPRLPRSWIEDTYSNLIHYGEADKGGHFAALEQPEILVSEIRTGLRTLRS